MNSCSPGEMRSGKIADRVHGVAAAPGVDDLGLVTVAEANTDSSPGPVHVAPGLDFGQRIDKSRAIDRLTKILAA